MAFSIDGAAAVVENQAVFTFLSPLKESGFKSPLAAEAPNGKRPAAAEGLR